MEEINSDLADTIFSSPAPTDASAEKANSKPAQDETKSSQPPPDSLIISIGTSEKKGEGLMNSHVTYTIHTKVAYNSAEKF
jgi:sorting nexin-1/2